MNIICFKNFRRVFIRLFFLGLFLFAGCGKQKNIDPGSVAGMTNASNFELLAAKHSDLPIPVGFKLKFASDLISPACHPEPVSGSRNINSNYLLYKGKSNLKNILKFYNQELELAGWQVNNFSNNLELLFVCEKPNKEMILSVRGAAGAGHPRLDRGSSKNNQNKIKVYFFVKKQNTLESKNFDLINSKTV